MKEINRWYYDNFKDRYAKLLALRSRAKEEDLTKIDETLEILRILFYKQGELSLSEKLELQAISIYETKDYHYIAKELAISEKIDFGKKYIHFPVLSDEEQLGFIHDFYRDMTDKDIFKVFKDMFKKRDKLLHMTRLMAVDKYPFAFFLPYFKEVHICFKKKRSFDDMINLAHEYGHGIQFLNNFNIEIFGENNVFSEIVSLFFELLLFEYMSNFSEFYPTVGQARMNIFNKYIQGGKHFMACAEVMYLWGDIYSLPFPIVKEFLEDKIKGTFDKPMSLEKMLKEDYTEDLPYLVGYSIAIELLMTYLEDKEFALYLLKELIQIDLKKPKNEYFESILDLGLTPGDSLEDYKKHIILPK